MSMKYRICSFPASYSMSRRYHVCFTDMVRFAMHTRSARRWFVQYLYIALCLFYRHGTLRDAHSLRSALVCTISIYCTMSVLQTWYASRCTLAPLGAGLYNIYILHYVCFTDMVRFAMHIRYMDSSFALYPKFFNRISLSLQSFRTFTQSCKFTF